MPGYIDVTAKLGDQPATVSVEIRSLDTNKPPIYQGPTKIVTVAPGQYYVIMTQPGYASQRSHVIVSEGQTVKVGFRLLPPQPTPARSTGGPPDFHKVKHHRWR